MGLREGLEEQAGGIIDQVRSVGKSAWRRTLRSFRAMIAEGGGALSAKPYLVALVQVVRGASPIAGIASQMAQVSPSK